MEEKKHPSPAQVADAFVKQYYVILNKCPENLHKFYQEPSLLGWPGVDGVVTPVTTLTGINKKVMSSDYKYCYVEVKTTDAQESLEGGIIVTVTGCLTRKDNVKKNYSQTFFLAKQEKGFFVLNDILRFFDVYEPITEASGNCDDESDQPAPTQNSAPCDSCDVPSTTLNFKAAIQNGKVEEAPSLHIPSGEQKSVSPEKDAKPQPVDAPNTNEKTRPSVKPVKIPSVVTPASNVASKITYASVLAREIPTAVTPNASKKAVASTTTKPSSSSPRGDVSPKVLATSGGVSKFTASSSIAAPKSPTRGQGIAEGKGIFIGSLPYEISKQGIVDVVKQFGPVRRYTDSIQIRRHPDGFCFGFVEFESADSANRAVQAHHVMFGDKEAYITRKRPPTNRGNNGGARSPMRRVQRNGTGNGNAGVAENGDWIHYSHRPRQASRDRFE